MGTDRLAWDADSYGTVFFVFIPKIFRAIHSGATKTWAGLVRNAGLFPSIRWPSQASANAAGTSSSATIQCHQTTINERETERNGNHVQGAVHRMVMRAVVMRIQSHIPTPREKSRPAAL